MSPPTSSLAVVTGATAGLGRVFADRLARRGHPLLIISRDAERLNATAHEIAAAHGVPVRVLPGDLSTDAGIEKAAALLTAEKNVGVLVNNAGFGTRGPIHEIDVGPQMRMLRLHMLAPMRLARAVLPGMIERHAGWIINVASLAGFVYSPGNANYCASKAYVIGLSRALDLELFGTGVVVQALCPGYTHTEFHQRASMDKTRVPGLRWESADVVVDGSIRAAERGRPVVVVPGWRHKLLYVGAKLAPNWFIRWGATRRKR